jgi:KaiC/GvpD/RAD55 family RecA-like ATPase
MKTTHLAQRESSASSFTSSSPTVSATRRNSRGIATSNSLDDPGSGLLQLKLGRAAHTYGLIAAFALLANAFFVYWVNQFGTVLALPLDLNIILWLLPLVVGGVMAAHAIDIKWWAYRSRRGSRHFVLSVAAFVVAMAGLLLTLLAVTGVVTLEADLGRFMYPYSVSAIALTLISMASTWSGHSARKMLSHLAAVVIPLLLATSAFAGMVPTTPGQGVLAMLLYFGGALAAEISGSLLHIIASSTAPVRREILQGSDEKLVQMQHRIKEAAKAIEYKRKGLLETEAIVESERAELESEAARVADQRREIVRLQAQAEADAERAEELDRSVARREAELETHLEGIKRRERRLAKAQGDVEKLRRAIVDHESSLSEREKSVKRGEIELESTLRQAEARLKAADEKEGCVADREEALEEKNKALIQTEKNLQLRASELEMKLQEAEATYAPEEESRRKDLQSWEARNLAKERELGQHEVELQSLEAELERMSEDARLMQSTLEAERKRLLRKDSELVSREKNVSDLEAGVKAREAGLDKRAATLRVTEAHVAESEKEYSTILMDAKLQQATATREAGDLTKRETALEGRNRKLDEREATLRAEIQRLNEGNREMRRLEKELADRESTLSLRELEMEQTAQEARAAASTGTVDVDREAYLEQWEKRLRDREERFKRERYQKEKEFEMREAAVKASIQADAEEAGEDILVETQETERVRTGTRRLDDLLYGGLPFSSSILWVGPAFVGKEVGILNFVAEGLRQGVPAVLVTTTKLPVDIAKDMAPILPTFIEFEQLGLVRWVDCSGTEGQPAGKYERDGSVYRVSGPLDYEALLAAVSDIDTEFREQYPYFRLAFLSLSSSIEAEDGRAGISFLQRLVNQLRRTKAVSAFSLERGMHTDQQLETLEHLMDGAIHFRSDKQQTMMSVVGIGQVQSRDWIPYRFTNKALMIGSFQLERIR